MTHTHKTKDFASEIKPISLSDELKDSFMPYALSVNTARAIPDIRDGLKPVQRRILYAMSQMSLHPASPHRKSAGIVGEVMGKYHPHGDGAIYEAMVRLGQPFASRVPLVDGKGNFGSLDDPPAAYRYTEARLATGAEALLVGMNENAVEMASTFDARGLEPVCLPGFFPALLVNGASGIGVAIATYIPPHNLEEIVSAVDFLLQCGKDFRNEKTKMINVKFENVAKFISGPDFPEGGVLIDQGGLEDAYRSGQGKVRLRACVTQEHTSRRSSLIFTNLPYMTGPERVVESARKALSNEKLVGVSEVTDESGRSGMRLVVHLHRNADIGAALESLWTYTPLEERISINMVAVVDKVPKQVTLLEMLVAYAEHIQETTVRRTKYRQERAEKRAHILSGLLIALRAIDKVVEIIRTAKNSEIARKTLKTKFSLDDEQTTAVLDLPLKRLGALEVTDLQNQHDSETKIITNSIKILSSDKNQRMEAASIMREFSAPLFSQRRTLITNEDPNNENRVGSIGSEEESFTAFDVVLTTSGRIGPLDMRGAKNLVAVRTHAKNGSIVAISSNGECRKITADAINDLPSKYIGLLSGDVPAFIVCASGDACRLSPEGIRKAVLSGSLNVSGRVVAASNAPDDRDVLLIGSDGKTLRCKAESFSLGNKASLRRGLNINQGACVGGFGGISDEDHLALLTSDNVVTVLALSELPAKGRGGGGMNTLNKRHQNYNIVATSAGKALFMQEIGKTKAVPLSPKSRGNMGLPNCRGIGVSP